MKGLFTIVLSLFLSGPLVVRGQCDDTLPDGTLCGEEDYMTVADPESCWKYYECDAGCVTHQTCPDDNKYDPVYAWCTYPVDVDCGDRPCDDDIHCPAPRTTTPKCDNSLPDGTICSANNNVMVADPESCWKYYACDADCVTHETCPDDSKFDPGLAWCTFPDDVDCGDRPCNDDYHCPAPRTTTTKEPDCTPEDQVIDCKEYGAGYYQDEFNCRKFWHCSKEGSVGEHITCPQPSDDSRATMFDLTFMGCNFLESTQCGGRPVCDDCNMNCEDI